MIKIAQNVFNKMFLRFFIYSYLENPVVFKLEKPKLFLSVS